MMQPKVKSGGRAKGTPNKITKDLKESISHFLNANIDSLQKDFDKLESRDKLMFIEKLLKYVIPNKIEPEYRIIGQDEYKNVIIGNRVIGKEFKNVDDEGREIIDSLKIASWLAKFE